MSNGRLVFRDPIEKYADSRSRLSLLNLRNCSPLFAFATFARDVDTFDKHGD